MSLERNLVPLTELEAVNVLLETIGEEPVSSLSDTGLSDVAEARRRLRLESRRLQSQGWSFNTNYAQEFPANNMGEILVPSNALSFDLVRSEGNNGMQRGNRLWNSDTNSWYWGKAVKVDWKIFLPFSELPESARWLVTGRAARAYQRTALGSESLERFLAYDEAQAWADFLRDEGSRSDNNIFATDEMRAFYDRTADSGPWGIGRWA